MAEKVNQFSNNSTCPKCGNKGWGIKKNYNRLLDLIERTCNGCGYYWKELPLDRKNNE